MGVLGELGDLGNGIRQGLADGVNATADVVGDSLDVVGLKSVGERVRDGAEYVTGAVGAEVPERELGETDQPGELIHGSTGDLEDTVRHLKAFASAFESTGQALKKLDPDRWTGTAADSFRESFTAHPKRWLTAADACTAAAAALAEYAHTVSWARGQAAEAIDKWRTAEAKSSAARQTYDRQAWEYQQYQGVLSLGDTSRSGAQVPIDPGEFVDPGEAGRDAAREDLRRARRTRDSAAENAAAKVTDAFASAPAEPGSLAKLKAGLMDGTRAVNLELEHFAGGFVQGGTGLIRMVRTVNPMDPYNLTHPAQYLQNVSVTGMGLLTAVNHPVRTAKSLVGSGWSSDPAEALGTLVFDLASDAVTGGAATGVGAARRTMTAVAEDALETAAERGARGAVGTAAEGTGESVGKAAAKQGGLPDGWTVQHGEGAADAAADATKDASRGKWDASASSGEGPPAPEAGTKSADPSPGAPEDIAQHRAAMADISDGAVTFDSNADAAQYGAKHWNDYAESLPDEQKAAVHDYTGPEHHRINGFLREGEGGYYDSPQVRRHVEQLDKALAGNALPEDVVVRRGTGLEHYLEKMRSAHPADMIGKKFTDDAYMSTSLGDAVFTNKEAVLHLRVAEGTPGLYVEKVGRYGADERELLLGRGNEYTVTEAFKDANGQWQIYGKIHR
ncbi:putative T7SS-secreted protein [Streptomyces sp. NPDC005303]|uniref:putative T7SS-secreted protein n=1 Tax=Streptomyces sp. NPDC005303 TaxID=3155713 RepID=UPI0033B70952